MKKTALFAAVLSALASTAFAQSSNVQLYGVVDSGLRVESSGGTVAAKTKDPKYVTGGGMSQSRLGINVNEDLGGGMVANVNMEHRFQVDTGTPSAADFWRQSWVGLTTPYGAIRFGRQYNALFDVTTTTFASFKYSPYIEAFKPELGMALGARNNNLVKYVGNVGGLRFSFGMSPSEGGAGASQQGYVRYETGPFSVGGGIESLQDAAKKKAVASALGAAYTSGPLYLSAAIAAVNPGDNFDRATLATLLSNGGTNGVLPATANANLDKRTMFMLNAGYDLSAQWNLGVAFWDAKQDTRAVAGATDASGKAKFFASVLDYRFSKRTDAYFEFDHTSFDGSLTFANGTVNRTGYMVGLRHRF
jgi:predicted porin